ncbi:MAG: hypothetical protein AAFX87_06845 [Bacteroidota bacterium]
MKKKTYKIDNSIRLFLILTVCLTLSITANFIILNSGTAEHVRVIREEAALNLTNEPPQLLASAESEPLALIANREDSAETVFTQQEKKKTVEKKENVRGKVLDCMRKGGISIIFISILSIFE